jgi:hypothetical protein
MYIGLCVKYPLLCFQMLMEIEFFNRFSKNPETNCVQLHPVGSELFDVYRLEDCRDK